MEMEDMELLKAIKEMMDSCHEEMMAKTDVNQEERKAE
jgi:hypothetical protein